ncbi:MAG: response regulator transcription factor [Betaproteobacteria bacterium]|nr:response regulator transcription factor [Betaproteobacteria bacterium]MBL8532336.1 response regulator transcription factor [Betaproteobacteria bacterium]
MRFLVVDDHPLIRRGIRQLLEEAYVQAEVAEADSGEAALDELRRQRFDLVILDLSLPGMSGLDVLAKAIERRPDQRVLMLSMHSETELGVQALRLGARGYITKDNATEQLFGAISKILGGGRFITAELAEVLADRLAMPPLALPHEALSSREFRVMRMLAAGQTPTEIAQALALSVKTVSTYRSRILDKMGLQNNADLTRYCLKHTLID